MVGCLVKKLIKFAITKVERKIDQGTLAEGEGTIQMTSSLW
jgi:hypothetical protein